MQKVLRKSCDKVKMKDTDRQKSRGFVKLQMLDLSQNSPRLMQ